MEAWYDNYLECDFLVKHEKPNISSYSIEMNDDSASVILQNYTIWILLSQFIEAIVRVIETNFSLWASGWQCWRATANYIDQHL